MEVKIGGVVRHTKILCPHTFRPSARIQITSLKTINLLPEHCRFDLPPIK